MRDFNHIELYRLLRELTHNRVHIFRQEWLDKVFPLEESMRTSCLDCVEKHLAQAWVLLSEFGKDNHKYQFHLTLALGHLAEAEDEALVEHGAISRKIREIRTRLQTWRTVLEQVILLTSDLLDLLSTVSELQFEKANADTRVDSSDNSVDLDSPAADAG